MNIPGLTYEDNVLTIQQEQQIVNYIDQQPWNTSLKRRTQHYSYEYVYTSRTAAKPTTPLGGPIKQIGDWLNTEGIIPLMPAQCIVNEYLKTQGISKHTDAKSFGPTIVSISLLQPCTMTFTKGSDVVDLCLQPRSMLVLSGEARYVWKHEIKPINHVSDDYRRLSLTFRTIK